MPQTKAAKKDVRSSKPRRQRNKSMRSLCKTSITKAEKAILSGDTESGQEAAKVAIRSLDKAAEKGIIHPNNSARRKSRLMKKLNKASAPSETE